MSTVQKAQSPLLGWNDSVLFGKHQDLPKVMASCKYVSFLARRMNVERKDENAFALIFHWTLCRNRHHTAVLEPLQLSPENPQKHLQKALSKIL